MTQTSRVGTLRTRHSEFRTQNSESGFTLVEVMVALAIAAIGVMGLMRLLSLNLAAVD